MDAPATLTQPNLTQPKLTQRHLDGIVAWNLVRAARSAERVMTDALTGFALTPVQFGVLAQLAVDGALTSAALARKLGVRPQSAATLVEGMQERGLVHRTGPRGRGRASPVQLTSQGAALLRAAWGPVMATNDVVGPSVEASAFASPDCGPGLNEGLGPRTAAASSSNRGSSTRPTSPMQPAAASAARGCCTTSQPPDGTGR